MHTAQEEHVELHFCLRTCTAHSMSPYQKNTHTLTCGLKLTLRQLFKPTRCSYGCSVEREIARNLCHSNHAYFNVVPVDV